MRVLIAARLSSRKSGGRDGIGIQTQDERSREWAAREGHVVAAVVADTKSGTAAPKDRRNLKPWVTDPALMAQYDAIVAYRMDRLSRGTQQDFTAIEHWADVHGKRLIIVDGAQYPARDDSDYWQWTATKREARREWEVIQERVTRDRAKMIADGAFLGRPAFGYAIAGEEYAKYLVTTPEGEKYVPEIFARVTAGESLADVAEWLAAEGVLTMQGGSWGPHRVGSVIRNPAYKGRRCAADRVTLVSECPALVDAAAWKRANDALDGRRKRGYGRAESAVRAMLAGVMACPGCGGPMYRVYCGAGRVRAAYYRCHGRGSTCRNLVLAATADALVSRWAANFDGAVMAARVIPGHDHAADLERVADALADLPRLNLEEEEEDGRRAGLRAERKRLAALPSVPDRTVWEDTGETYAGQWAALDAAGRGAWLRGRGIRVQAARTDRGLCEDRYRPLAMGVDYTASWLGTADGVSVIVSWLGAGISAAAEEG